MSLRHPVLSSYSLYSRDGHCTCVILIVHGKWQADFCDNENRAGTMRIKRVPSGLSHGFARYSRDCRCTLHKSATKYRSLSTKEPLNIGHFRAILA